MGTTDESEEESPRKRGFPWVGIATLGIIGFLLIGGMLKGSNCNFGPATITRTVSQVKAISAAVTTFKDMYGFLPGDLKNAGTIIRRCFGKNAHSCDPLSASAGDNIVGVSDFNKTLKPQVIAKTRIPAISAGDETILFWAHLSKADLIPGVTDAGLNDGSPIEFGTVLPKAPSGGGFIVGHADGGPFAAAPPPIDGGLKGTILVQISDALLHGDAEPNESDEQALTPLDAARLDRKMDDGRPLTGYVQGYGAPGCFTGPNNDLYNETNQKHDCGLIYRIEN